MHPFHGMNTVDMEQYSDLFPEDYEMKLHFFHGVAMSPMFTFLMDRYNPELDLMKKIYEGMQQLANFSQPINVILNSVSVPENIWWPEFIRAYLEGGVWDLSARLCLVKLSRNLSESVLGEEDQLHFKLGPENRNLDYTKVLVFGYKEDQLEFLSEGVEVTIDNIKGLIDMGFTTLLAAVVNSASEAPYQEEIEIDLIVKIIEGKNGHGHSWLFR